MLTKASKGYDNGRLLAFGCVGAKCLEELKVRHDLRGGTRDG